MPSWYDNETFWKETASVVFNEQRRTDASGEVEQVLRLMDRPSGAHLLDLGCGIGRHSRELARCGFRVTGVDRTASYLEEAKRLAIDQGLNVDWVKCDMREFVRPDTFDGAVNLLTSFGYFEDPADDRRVMENLFRSLKPGGRLLIDLMSKEVLAKIFRPRDWHRESDGTILLEERTIRDDWTWLDVCWRIVRDGKVREHRFSLRQYAASDLRNLLAGAGFERIRAYGSLAGAPYDHEAQRLVMLADRPR